MSSTPQHVAIIMDGNGRWAKKRFLPRAVGHDRGARSVQRAIDLCLAHGVEWLTLYAFSTENWGRSEKEVTALMGMLKKYLRERTDEMMEKGVRLHVIGELYMLPEDCQEVIRESIARTAGNARMNLVLAISYGSRQEITAAAKALAQRVLAGELAVEEITPEHVEAGLYTAGMPDPDLLIRTSGELRLSNYLLWQLSYAEIYVTETLWPDFGEGEFLAALEAYSGRQRRYGKR